MAHAYFIINKPYGVLSQFTREVADHRVLGDLYAFPPRVYPVGRLDRDSEGLLILTDDGRLNGQLLDPAHGHPRTYWVQVEGDPTEADLARLAAGPEFRVKKRTYRPARLSVRRIAPALAPRTPPVRFRKNVPDCWLELTLTEGKNRQVRRMCAAVGFPVLRLVRYAIGRLTLDEVGETGVRQVEGDWLRARLELR